MWDCLMVAEGQILVLFSKGVVKATDEESGCLFKLVNVESLVYAVYSCLVVKRVDERSKAEHVVRQGVIKSCITCRDEHIGCNHDVVKGFKD